MLTLIDWPRWHGLGDGRTHVQHPVLSGTYCGLPVDAGEQGEGGALCSLCGFALAVGMRAVAEAPVDPKHAVVLYSYAAGLLATADELDPAGHTLADLGYDLDVLAAEVRIRALRNLALALTRPSRRTP